MRPIRRGDRGPAVAEIRRSWSAWSCSPHRLVADDFDADTERAVRAFQQSRGLSVDGVVGEETWRALDAARWRLGARTLYHAVPDPLIGDDVRPLQERLLEMGYDLGRADGIYGAATARAVAQFQREVGLTPDGSCGPQTMNALRRLGRKVVGGRPQLLREAEAFRQSGPALVGKRIVIDPGHGGADDLGVVGARRAAALDRGRPGVRPRRPAGGPARRGRHAGAPHPRPAPARPLTDADRAQLANDLGADLLISLHLDGHANPDGGRRRHLPLRHRLRRDARRWGSGWPGSCSARSSPAPACATARPTPRRGTCCG